VLPVALQVKYRFGDTLR